MLFYNTALGFQISALKWAYIGLALVWKSGNTERHNEFKGPLRNIDKKKNNNNNNKKSPARLTPKYLN